MHQRARDRNPSQKSVHDTAAPHHRARLHHTNRTIPTQYRRLGTQPNADKTWINLRPHIQEAYQRPLTLGTVTSAQGVYAQNNCFAGLMTNEESNDDTANTIAGTITSHMAKIFEMTKASINEHTTQTNASLQQLAANTNQLQQQQQDIINQMAMMTMNHGAPTPATHQTFARAPPPIYPPALP